MMDGYDKMRDIVRHREVTNEASRENYKVLCRKKLAKNIETKINTTMIGALDAVERHFGSVWGEGKPISERTPKEVAMLAVKDQLRTEILNNGNNQKRAALAEINQYEVEWMRHHVDLTVAPDEALIAASYQPNPVRKEQENG